MLLLNVRHGKAMSAAIGAAVLLWAGGAAAEPVRVGGTGIGLRLADLLGHALEATDPSVSTTVLPSLGTSGGIKAVGAGAIDVAIAARPLKDTEKETGVTEAACLTTALVFVTSRHSAPGISLSSLPRLYADPDPRWPDGQPLKVILRSPAGSENPYLIRLVPGMEEALAKAFARPGIPVGATDQENAALAARTEGSFAIATLLQVKAEKLKLLPLALDGVDPGPKSLADGTYPMPLPVCFLLPAKAAPGAAKFIGFARSPAGQKIIRDHGGEPVQ